ncbi:MAG: hypothetical protein LUH19_00550 [Lachnospiraceae bacterium]|nr:hypothetical protein [Lachnospiraceae bacterium]
MALVPVLCCVMVCALQGHKITDIYLPASDWNDELFYYKQVEGMIKYGYPYGYFGFNESHAQVLSFAAWSPVLVWPWLLWGLLFGWNLMSPIYCNLFLMTAAVFLFVYITEADWRQCVSIAVLYAVFPLTSRYILSVMPECVCFAMGLVFWACAYSYFQKESTGRLAAMFVISAVLTLMRPYMILFLALPSILLIMKKRWLGVVGSLGIVGVTGIGYVCIKKFLAAEYFTALFDTSWLTNFIYYGVRQGFAMLIQKFCSGFLQFMDCCRQGIVNRSFTGLFFIGFLIVMLLLLVWTVTELIRKEYWQALLYGHLFLSFAGMWVALLLMYKMQEGSKHLLTFIVVGFFALAMTNMTKWGRFVPTVLCGVCFICLYGGMLKNNEDFRLSFYTEELAEVMDQTGEQLQEALSLNMDNTPNYDNDVIWVVSDRIADNASVSTDYQILYGLPAGFGISCCYAEYVQENFDELQSRYICTVAGGQIDELCQERGMTVIAQGLNAVVYQLR